MTKTEMCSPIFPPNKIEMQLQGDDVAGMPYEACAGRSIRAYGSLQCSCTDHTVIDVRSTTYEVMFDKSNMNDE